MDKDKNEARRKAVELVKAFINGPDHSVGFAGQIEGILDASFPDNVGIQDLIIALASYRPEGGPHLYDEREMLALLKRDLPIIERLAAQE